MNNIHISIITLNKNDHLKFLKTLRSIAIQKISFCVEWLILDGSDQNIYKKNKAIIRKELLLKKDFQINRPILKKWAKDGRDEWGHLDTHPNAKGQEFIYKEMKTYWNELYK